VSDIRKAIQDLLPADARGLTAPDVVREAASTAASGYTDNVADISGQLAQLRALVTQQVSATTDNTQAVTQSTRSHSTVSASSTVASVAKSVVKTVASSLALAPLVSSIIGLFKGSKAEPPELEEYAWPAAIRLEGGIARGSGQGIVGVDYWQNGMPRAITSSTAYHVPSVTVQVQTMDSRSFLDNSDRIARAVREALLSAHSLGDVISEF
jgi:hypothetical protein